MNCRYAKVDVLLNYWDKLLGHIQFKATKRKDEAASKLCQKFMLVPQHVKIHMLRKYIEHCRKTYAIAFF